MTIRFIISLFGVIIFSQNTFAVEYRGRYVNQDYGFAVTIPPGYTGRGAAESAPNHGFLIATPDGSVIAVDANYDTIVSPSGQDLTQQLTRSKGPPTALLGGLKAWKSSGIVVRKGRRVFEQGIVARRVSEAGDAIIYTISETTDEHKHQLADSLFDQLVASFRVIAIPSSRR